MERQEMKTNQDVSSCGIEEFRMMLYESEKSEATISKYMHDVSQFLEFLGERELTKGILLEYRERLNEQFKPQTVNGKLSAIHIYLEYLGREDCRVKFLHVQHKAFVEESRELTEKEYRRLLKAARDEGNERMYHLMVTICGTGIRISELKYITTEAVEAGRSEIAMKGKIRVVLISKKLRKLLKKYIRDRGIKDGPVFCTRNGRAMDRSNVCHEMKRLCKLAGVDKNKVFPHNLRHLFARTFYAIKKNLANIADVLGHSSVETTRIYVATSEREHEKTLGQMNLLL